MIDRENCSLCKKCIEVCPTCALTLVGESMTVEDVFQKVEQDRPFYEKSGGGVTLSGGEPLLQFEFSKELLRKCKRKSIHTAIETNGYCEWQNLQELSEFADVVLYDIKVLDNTKHLLFTGVSNRLILNNLRALVRLKNRIVIRYPLIPRHNDGKEDIKALAKLIFKLRLNSNAIDELHLLPYHKYGIYKYSCFGIGEYQLKNLEPPTDFAIKEIKRKLTRLHIKIRIGG